MTMQNTRLQNKLKNMMNKEVDDILLFGSTVRGKEKPEDTDILIIFKNKVVKEAEYKLRKALEKYFPKVSFISKTRKTVIDSAFDARESILFEGLSLLTGKNLARQYGFTSFGMFKYDFGNWDKLQKTKFYYALNGRKGGKGISQKLGCVKLSDRILLVPLHNIELFREFLESWELEYKYIPCVLPERLSQKKILEP